MGIRKSNKFTSVVLAFIMLAHFIGVTFYTHKHIYNGKVIVHSHFFVEGYEDTHNHTDSELFAIDLLASLSYFVVLFTFTSFLFRVVKCKYVNSAVDSFKMKFIGANPLRGPPQFTVLSKF